MPYGQIKVDEITFTNAGVDQTISVSGVVGSISGSITATGTISGDVIRGGTLVSGATVTGTAGQFGTITGNTAAFTTVTGTTVTGTTANFVTVSGTTVTGATAQFTTLTGGTAGFTTITGTTITGTTLTVASGTFSGNSTAAAFIPTGSTVPTNGVYLPAANTVGVATNGTQRLTVDTAATTSTLPIVHPLGAAATPSLTFTGDLNTGIYSPGADQVAISTGGSQRLLVDASGNIGFGSQFTLLQTSGTLQNTEQIRVRLQHVGIRRDAAIRVTYTGGWTASTVPNRKGFFDAIAAWGISGTNTFVYLNVNDIATRCSFHQPDFEVVPVGANNRVDVIIRNPSSDEHTYALKIEVLSSSGAISVIESVQEAKTAYVGMNTNHELVARGSGVITAVTDDIERMRITSAGLVGVGTSSPINTLHVVGTGRFNVSGSNNAVISSDSGDPFIYTEQAAGLKFGTNSAVRMTINSSGSVGIGTTSVDVAAKAAISNGGAEGFEFRAGNTAGVCEILTYNRSTNSYTDFRYDSATHRWGIGGNEKARLDASGRFLVGTSTATNNLRLDAKLAVVSTGSGNLGGVNLTNYGGTAGGAASFIDFNRSRGTTDGSLTSVASGDTLGYLVWRGATGSGFNHFAQITAEVDGTPGNNDAPGRLVFSTTADGASSPTERMRINNAGAVFFPSVSTTASAANAFLNSGSSPANQLLRSTSSLRYKTDIEDLEEERSASILDFRPVWYRSTAEADRSDWSWYGLIAEEVAEIEPRLVHWTYLDDAYEEVDGEKQLKPDAEMVPDGVQYDRLTVLLLDVVKRQQQAIETLEAKVTALESQ